MTYLSIFEKLKILFNMVLDFKVVLFFIGVLCILTFIYIIKKITAKKYMLSVIVSLIVTFIISVISNYKILSNTFDDFATILFSNIYFPSIYVYIGVSMTIFIAFIISILNQKQKKIYKFTNSIIFILNSILLIIILNIIAKNKIDIFSIASLYTNKSLVAILEISMGLFIVWIITLIITYTTNYICRNKQTVSTNDLYIKNNNNTVEKDSILLEPNNEPQEEKKHITKEVIVESNYKSNNNILFDDIINRKLPVTYYETNTVQNSEYNLINPQQLYEEKYNMALEEIKKETSLQGGLEDITSSVTGTGLQKPIIDNISILEDTTKQEKERLSKERLLTNTISLNDLVEETINQEELTKEINETIKEEVPVKEIYTIEDYKQIIKMLNSIKNYSNTSNISVDDAVSISLISNYSIDDCIKFKEILESNLN